VKKRTKFLLSILLGVLLLEVGLRVAGGIYLKFHERPASTGAPHALLCLGDSHTFGIWLKAAETYPAQLEQLLNAGETTRQWDVVNRGVPGMASADVLDRMEQCIRERTWDAIVVTVGANDRWKGVERRGGEAWYDSIQIVKLFKLLVQARAARAPKTLDPDRAVHPDEIAGTANTGKNTATISIVDRSGRPVEFEQSTTGDLLGDAELQTRLESNLARMVDEAKARDARLFFLSYGNNATNHGIANRAMKKVADASRVPFVDAAAPLEAAAREYAFEDLYFPDLHPAAGGCVAVARSAFNGMVDSGIINKRKIEGVTAGLPRGRGEEAPFELYGSLAEKNLSLEVRADPGRLVHVFLSHTQGPPADVLGHRVPIGRDALFDRTLEPVHAAAMRGVADEHGAVRIQIFGILDPATRPGTTLYVAAAFLGLNGAPGLHTITGARQFTIK
jgi:lysophospholipase L1-like esterase